jgi:ribonuclease P protein component
LIFEKKPDAFKLTIVVTKKIAPRAVDRNRIKRLLKEAFRRFTQLDGGVKIIVKSNLSGLKLDDVLRKLEPLILKIK